MTLMEQEAQEAPSIITNQLRKNAELFARIRDRLKKSPPPFAMTIARGSSDHAATFAKYLLETRCELVTASAAPSVCTLYEAKLNLKNALVIAISQSGQSPDIAEMLHYAKKSGAMTLAFVNQTDSSVAQHAEYVIPLQAGEETSVAATKTFLATLSALIQFVAIVTEDNLLQEKLNALPDSLAKALQMNWQAAIDCYQNQTNTFVIARGFGFPIALEAALKFKETAKIHAEAFSSAELLHGPFALVQKDFPILMFSQHDATLKGLLEVAKRIQQIGGKILMALPFKTTIAKDFANSCLPLPESLHPICDPLQIAQAFYVMIARLSVARGLNPDVPNNLSKVTQTW